MRLQKYILNELFDKDIKIKIIQKNDETAYPDTLDSTYTLDDFLRGNQSELFILKNNKY
jgi:hypothetical protein